MTISNFAQALATFALKATKTLSQIILLILKQLHQVFKKHLFRRAFSHSSIRSYNLATLSKDHTRNTVIKGSKKITYLRIENLKNDTLFRGTYLYGPYVGVPPPGSFVAD